MSKDYRAIALQHAVNSYDFLSDPEVVVQAAKVYYEFLTGDRVVEAEVQYEYYRRVRGISGRPLHNGDLYRFRTEDRGRLRKRAEYLSRDLTGEVWVRCQETTIGHVLNDYNNSVMDKVTQP